MILKIVTILLQISLKAEIVTNPVTGATHTERNLLIESTIFAKNYELF